MKYSRIDIFVCAWADVLNLYGVHGVEGCLVVLVRLPLEIYPGNTITIDIKFSHFKSNGYFWDRVKFVTGFSRDG